MPAIIHIVDDDASFRRSLAQLLRTLGYDVALYGSAEEMLGVPQNIRPGCILLDVKMPGLSGPDLQTRLTEMQSPWPIIFLTGLGTIPESVRAIKAGAEDFLSKPVAKADLLAAVSRAIARSGEILARREQLSDLRARAEKLTPRERKVFELVAAGQINKQIAFALGTTERTIKAHRQKVMQKLDAHSVVELMTIAERLGLPTAHAGLGQAN